MSTYAAILVLLKLNFLKRFYLFILERGEGREKERERNIDWLPLTHPLLGTWSATQARALTENQTSDLSVERPVVSPLRQHQPGPQVKCNLYVAVEEETRYNCP